MICRRWRAWILQENAAEYELLMRNKVMPEIEALARRGLRHIDLVRKVDTGVPAVEVEFATMMWFDTVNAVIASIGMDYEITHIARRAKPLLSRFDDRPAHYLVVDRGSSKEASFSRGPLQHFTPELAAWAGP